MYRVILYYNFAKISNPKQFCLDHKRILQWLGLVGRVYIAQEGINGTLSGLVKDVEFYESYLRSLPGFERTEFKEDNCEVNPFVKLIVKTRPEIVTLKTEVLLDPTKEKGRHLSPEDWRNVLDKEKDFVLIDVRNKYESDIGHFDGAIKPDVENFYNFPEWLDQANLSKDKKVLMYCTGGIRCEKFSVLMEKKGFKEVYQLHGGIINYAQRIGDAHYKGKCFVFDDRLAVPVEKNQKEPVGRCEITGQPCDTYLNCANLNCNNLFLCSPDGAKKYQGCCSPECMKAEHRRPFNENDIYSPTRKWYKYDALENLKPH
jgi:UPF0176 protein